MVTVPQGTDTGDGGGNVINPETVKRGDTNGDGKITLMDLTNVQRHLLEKKKLTDENLISADTNGDGNITLIDLTRIQRYLLGKLEL